MTGFDYKFSGTFAASGFITQGLLTPRCLGCGTVGFTTTNTVARAIESQYGVSVVSVRIASIPGKSQRSIRKKGRSVRTFKRGNVRKAYVALKAGDKLPLFAATEEGSKPEKESK